MEKHYKFSIVIAIYNMENYLTDAINSLINQSIGFEDNLQVLLVNDGSIDNSEAICKSFVNKFPQNIEYIFKENGGVSEARNKGLEYATGELVNFLDADDKLEVDALEKVYNFYFEHKDEVDLISIPLYFFEGEDGEHLLNYKFTSTRVIDIFKEPKCFQMHISSSFLKLQEIKKYRFNSKLKFGEDAEVANKIILNKGKYGVVSDTKYMYRKRNAGTSVIQGARTNRANYLPPLKYLHLELIRFAMEKYDRVPEYLQRMLIYDLGWKIRVPHIDPTVMEQSEIGEFITHVKKILSYIDDDIILAGFNIKRCYNLYLLTLKHQDISKDKLVIIKNKVDAMLCYENSIVDMLHKQVIYIENVEFEYNMLRLSGSFYSLFTPYEFKLMIDINGRETNILYQKNEKYQVTSLNQFVDEGYDFYIDIPLDKKEAILKAKIKLGETKTQVKFMLQEKLAAGDTNSQLVSVGDYSINIKNKELIIEKKIVESNEEKNSNRDISLKPRKKVLNSIRMFVKNQVLYNSIKRVLCICDRNTINVIMKKLDEKNFLNKIANKFPVHYRNYVMFMLKNGRGCDIRMATTYNQACIYQREQLLSKLSDITINTDKFEVEKDSLSIAGTVISPFNSNLYQLSCFCNKKKIDCELNLNKKKSIKLRNEDILGCYEYELKVPIQEESEIYFELSMEEAKVIPQIIIKEDMLAKASKKTRYQIKIFDKKQIKLYY